MMLQFRSIGFDVRHVTNWHLLCQHCDHAAALCLAVGAELGFDSSCLVIQQLLQNLALKDAPWQLKSTDTLSEPFSYLVAAKELLTMLWTHAAGSAGRRAVVLPLCRRYIRSCLRYGYMDDWKHHNGRLKFFEDAYEASCLIASNDMLRVCARMFVVCT